MTTVYKLYDRKGELLYVGISERPLARWGQHSKAKPWWTQVARFEVENFDDRLDAARREADLIERERPAYNIRTQFLPFLGDTEPELVGKHVGVAEIADALGVRRDLVAQWHRRGRLPEPDGRLAAGPIWHTNTIEEWIRAQKGEGR